MNIDTSSIADRFNQLRPNATSQTRPFDQSATSLKETAKSAIKRRTQLAQPNTPVIRHQKPTVNTATDVASQRPSVRATQDQPENPINSLLADWGKADSDYDLNSDGTVNTADLLMLLVKLGGQDNSDNTPDLPTTTSKLIPTPSITEPSNTPVSTPEINSGTNLVDPAPIAVMPDNANDASLSNTLVSTPADNLGTNLADPVPIAVMPDNANDASLSNTLVSTPADNLGTNLADIDPTQEKPESLIDKLLADWGKTDSQYDLNEDGTVSTQDLLMLLSRLGNTQTQAVDQDGTIVSTGNSSDGPHPSENPVAMIASEAQNNGPIQSLLNDWGNSDSPYDYNGDGTVSTADLLMLLSKMGQSDDSSDNEVPITDQTIFSLPGKDTASDDNVKPIIDRIAKGITARLLNLHDQDGNTGIKEPGQARTAFRSIGSNGNLEIDKQDLKSTIQDLLMGSLDKGSSANINKFINESIQLFTENKINAQATRSETHTSINHAYQRINTEQAVNQLAQRLANNGESELRKFLNNTDFTNAEKRSILSELHNLNMGTLGVNVVG